MAQKRKRRIPVADLECCLQAEQLHRRSVRRQSHWEDAYQTEIGKLKMELSQARLPAAESKGQAVLKPIPKSKAKPRAKFQTKPRAKAQAKPKATTSAQSSTVPSTHAKEIENFQQMLTTHIKESKCWQRKVDAALFKDGREVVVDRLSLIDFVQQMLKKGLHNKMLRSRPAKGQKRARSNQVSIRMPVPYSFFELVFGHLESKTLKRAQKMEECIEIEDLQTLQECFGWKSKNIWVDCYAQVKQWPVKIRFIRSLNVSPPRFHGINSYFFCSTLQRTYLSFLSLSACHSYSYRVILG